MSADSMPPTSEYISVSERTPPAPGLYKVWTGNNQYPSEQVVYFDGFDFVWMGEAITHWKPTKEHQDTGQLTLPLKRSTRPSLPLSIPS